MSYTIAQIAYILGEKPSLNAPDSNIIYILTDSRKLAFPESTLFFALDTEQRSGSQFVADLFDKGVRNFVIGKFHLVPSHILDAANVLRVDDSLEALQTLARFHRQQFHYPVIGITGSNGKTIVKEWLNQLLSPDWNIVRTPRSFNSQIGVPLSIWEMKAENNLGIFEAGISLPNEMQRLEKIIQPTIGIFTNIGSAHDEGFENREEKLLEKIKLFKNCQKVIFPSLYLEGLKLENLLTQKQLFTWGKNENDFLQIKNIVSSNTTTTITARVDVETIAITIPFTDDASIENAINCWCLMLLFDVEKEVIQERMLQLRAVDMRLQIVPALNNCTLINDSYSFDINSLNIALSFLRQQKITQTVIISDLAYYDEENYKAIVSLLEHNHIDRVVAIGPTWEKLSKLLNYNFKKVNVFPTVQSFLDNIPILNFNKEAILLKGARKFSFERIARFLSNSVHQTRLEISIPALSHNLQLYRKYIKPETKIVAMVKAFAYGCGSIEVATMAQYFHVDYLAVAYADEGISLRNSGITLPIMVMNFDEEAFDAIVNYNLEPNIFSFKIYNSFNLFLLNQGIKNYPIHIKIDTGMHRLGFELEEIAEIASLILSNNTMHVRSAFSHFVASEDPDEDNFTHTQANLFLKGTAILENILNYSFIKHISNTSGIIRFPQYQMDMVRLGIGLYGVDSSSLIQDKLENVATLITTIAQIHKVKNGDTVGYNRKGKVFRDSIIATIRIGYADGLNRKLGNGNGYVFIKGKKVPFIGNICMDMAMVDITDIPNVYEGDSVEIFGNNIPVSTVAKSIGTISYEVLTSIGQRIKRVYVEE
ncbi:MAG: bifunctional UDP-N-acetylmuramoyl-tripeptide:D-alanyl-D-alanine ligase/alanine racemase [Pseudopedobacter saltans]|uniref:Alanine racemase n=1 Tax=Pseudopedobacter saltans TaxID=151895 RepID=A0A2W5EMS7_9SPHI|nr:MAG: bifunctional UDP-N-acetylmuramoyl-tripeptide:D-alanyl-D-alanine ligase/alanine racemase [Pseudopedobacter saltans]